jgi:hypothetical protein
MKKTITTLIIILIYNFSYCQLKAKIIDSETKENIPYVNIWIENENVGTTSDETGQFELTVDSSKIIVFSAIGFETRKILSDSIKNILELKPTITELEEVLIKSKKQTKKLTLGKFSKRKVNHYFACGTKPWISARFYEYKEEYSKVSFLNKIKVLTNSEVKDSKFNIRLYEVNENGEPENYLYDDNIIGTAKKGQKTTEVDISNLNIQFPKNGFFIAIEWLIIDTNKNEYTFSKKGTDETFKRTYYDPKIGTVPVETNENSWIFTQGNWKRVWKTSGANSKNKKDRYDLIAIELILTN